MSGGSFGMKNRRNRLIISLNAKNYDLNTHKAKVCSKRPDSIGHIIIISKNRNTVVNLDFKFKLSYTLCIINTYSVNLQNDDDNNAASAAFKSESIWVNQSGGMLVGGAW